MLTDMISELAKDANNYDIKVGSSVIILVDECNTAMEVLEITTESMLRLDNERHLVPADCVIVVNAEDRPDFFI